MSSLRFFFRFYITWLLLFMCGRLIFLALNWDALRNENDLSDAFLHGLKLDLSVTGYLMVPVFILWMLSRIWFRHGYSKIINVVVPVLIFISSVILVANARLYREWGTPINHRALSYLSNPAGAVASLSFWELLGLLFLLFVLVVIFVKRMKRKGLLMLHPPLRHGRAIFQVFIYGLLIFISIRGGIGLTPVNEASAYYAGSPLKNHLALNPVWYLGNNLLTRNTTGNPYKTMDEEEAIAHFKGTFPALTDTFGLQLQKPNILFVILESFSADLINLHQDGEEVTPFFNSLVQSGLSFSQIYSSGFRTDQGLASILSGYPSVPDNSILRYPSKTESLPVLSKSLVTKGYQSFFVYGGDPDFANMSLLLKHGGFSPLIGEEHFESGSGKWGAGDKVMLSELVRQADQAKQPFFGVGLTLSLHAPFEMGEKGPFSGDGERMKFLNTARYVDEALAAFIREVRQKSWYQNTLIVLVADHGHTLATGRDYYDPGSRRVPLLFLGDLIPESYRGMVVRSVGSHHDIPATVLNMIGSDAAEYSFSRNLFGLKEDGFAFLAFDPGFGAVSDSGSFVFHHGTERFFWPAGGTMDNQKLWQKAAAWEQILYDDFLQR